MTFKNRKGFTLIELLAVVAIIGLLGTIVAVSVTKVYNDSIKKTMIVQENNVASASKIYLEDYCFDPVDSSYVCPTSYNNYTSNKYICLDDLQDNKLGDYINKVTYKKDECKGIITFDKNEDGDYVVPNVYLYCGNPDTGEYGYITDESLNPGLYPRCNIKINNDMYYLSLMEEKLSEIHSILQRENELIVQASNDTNLEEDIKAVKEEINSLNNEINNVYNYEYLGSKILQPNNELTGKYVVKIVSPSNLKIDSFTFSDYDKDLNIVYEAIRTVSYFRSSLGAEINALEYRLSFYGCSDKECKLDVVLNMVKRIYELSYRTTYSTTDSDDDRLSIDMEVQKLFDNLDVFSKNMSDSSISKNSIFKNGDNVLTKASSKKVYDDAAEYIKNNSKKDLTGSDVWQDEVSMLQTASGALNDVINISYRMHELMTSCSNGTNTSSDIKSYDDELTALIKGIDDVKKDIAFNGILLFGDSDYYSDYLLYDIHDDSLSSISCANYNSNSLNIIKNYQRKMNLNMVSLNANNSKAEKLITFTKCKDNNCIVNSVKDILNSMLELAISAVSGSDNEREEYNIQYVTYFKALNHIAEITENNSYSASSLGVSNTNLSSVSNATTAKSIVTSALSKVK